METKSAIGPSSPRDRPIIAVCGATGFQGGSLVNHLLRDGKFAVRALTRKIKGPAAKQLILAGADVVYADYDDLDSLCRAFDVKGCYGAYGMTDYFEAFEKESQQGINIVDAAKAAGVKHLIFSTAPETPNMKVNAFLHKRAAANHLKDSGVPYTLFTPGAYYGNIFLLNALTKLPSGIWRLDFPFPVDVPIPGISPRDIGGYLLAIFKSPSEWLGEEMYAINEYITLRQHADTFGEVSNTTVEIRETTREEFMALEHAPFVIEAWGIFKHILDEYEHGSDTWLKDMAKNVYPDRQTWRDFLVEHSKAPILHPLTIQCLRTREQFRN